LKAIGEKHIPGIPTNLRILLLGQTVATEKGDDASNATETVLQHVVRSDTYREQVLNEVDCMINAKYKMLWYLLTSICVVLSTALESTSDSSAAAKAARKLKFQRRNRDLEEAKKIAARRSGSRGLKARKELRELEEELRMSELS
jgi:ATP-binding cassette subfamily F protein 3